MLYWLANNPPNRTFVDYIVRWQKQRSPFLPDGSVGTDADLHPSTWIHDESLIRRHFIPAFGPLCLDEVDVARCREFRRTLVDARPKGKDCQQHRWSPSMTRSKTPSSSALPSFERLVDGSTVGGSG
jgi:hypothetical protein